MSASASASSTDRANDTCSSKSAQKTSSSSVEKLGPLLLNNTTTSLLLGDSVIRGINMAKSSRSAEDIGQKVCIPGITGTDLIARLKKQSPSPQVQTVTFHVGVNTCKHSPVDGNTWTDLVKECRRVFPHASLCASAILPAKGRSPLNANIRLSNDALNKVCGRLGVAFVSHDNIFTTDSGAPRLALYRDVLHPSPKGTARIAENLFGPGNDGNQQPRTGDPKRQMHHSMGSNVHERPPPLVSQEEYPLLIHDHTQAGHGRPPTSHPQHPPSHAHHTSVTSAVPLAPSVPLSAELRDDPVMQQLPEYHQPRSAAPPIYTLPPPLSAVRHADAGYADHAWSPPPPQRMAAFPGHAHPMMSPLQANGAHAMAPLHRPLPPPMMSPPWHPALWNYFLHLQQPQPMY